MNTGSGSAESSAGQQPRVEIGPSSGQSVIRVPRIPVWTAICRIPILSAELVADAPHGQEHLGPSWVSLDLLAKPSNVNIDRPVVHERILAPDSVEQGLSVEDEAPMAGEGGEQIELLARKVDPVAVAAHLAPDSIDGQVVDHERVFAGLGPKGPFDR